MCVCVYMQVCVRVCHAIVARVVQKRRSMHTCINVRFGRFFLVVVHRLFFTLKPVVRKNFFRTTGFLKYCKC